MFVKDLQQERNLLRLIQRHHLEKLYALDNPSGILLCHKHKNGFRWQQRSMQDGRPVTVDLRKADRAQAEKLAVNMYRMICILYIQKLLASLENIVDGRFFGEPAELQQNCFLTELSIHELFSSVRNYPRVPAEFFDSESPYKPLILAHLQKEYAEIIDWYLGDYEQYNEHPEHLLFPVKLGYKVRSKSEVIIADRLYQEGILFHYEEMLLLSSVDVHPDFFVPVTVVEKYAWEHNGAMDNEYYFSHARGKIINYIDHSWFPGINMITTYETRRHPLTEEMVEHKIRWLKNRYRLAFPDLPPDESFNMYDLVAQVQSQKAGR